jgi:hypothetical protein
VFSIKEPSHVLKNIYLSLISEKLLLVKLKKYITPKNKTLIFIDKYKLLLVSVNNSEILISININVNKNNIDTAPIYTNK